MSNPLLEDWKQTGQAFGLPPFSRIQPSHFQPAFDIALAEQLEEISIIAAENKPTFENTMAAFDRSGGNLSKISLLFENLTSSATNEELQTVELKMAPVLAGQDSKVYTYPGLFDRISTVYQGRHAAGLAPEQIRLCERLHSDFVRMGARFDAASQARYAEVCERLAILEATFTQNLLADETQHMIVLGAEDLAGLPADLVSSARQAAVERKMGEHEYVITLSRSSVEPFLTYSTRRDLRQRAWSKWTRRGELEPARDNKAIATEILVLRQEQARLHGAASFAEYQLQDTMAQKPGNVMQLLEQVWEPAKQAADQERAKLEAYIAKHEAESKQVEAWDWRFYAEKVRISEFDFDESQLKPYLSLEAVTAAVFAVANQLFGVTLTPRPDLASYHPDVVTYEVRNSEGVLVAVFLHDNFARAGKSSGAWMSELRTQGRNPNSAADAAANPEAYVPVILNNNNFARGSPTLLSFDDAITLFHEFGHGCHGMLSNVTYNRLAGTSVLRDFVELPSQLMEWWLKQPEVLTAHAKHHETGEVVPEALLKKMFAAQKFNQGFETIEYAACALIDQALHSQTDHSQLDLDAFEAKELARLGMPQGIIMRHRPAHFAHLFSGSSYASAYYVYLWAEVLDSDAFEAFLETGNIFDKATAQRVLEHIYSAGDSVEPGEAFRRFRGRDPKIEPMLRKKGLSSSSSS